MQYPHSKKYIKKDGLNHLASMYHVFARYLCLYPCYITYCLTLRTLLD